MAYIKTHGTWRSSAVEGYLLQAPRFDTPVQMILNIVLLDNYFWRTSTTCGILEVTPGLTLLYNMYRSIECLLIVF